MGLSLVYSALTAKATATNLATVQMERGRTLIMARVPMAVQAGQFGSLFVLRSLQIEASISTSTMIL